MAGFDIYKDIAERTNGDIYIGVVGPVRTGKSTFIKRFMDLLVLPNIENTYTRERARDELPQSASGKNIMTTEPKFVPNEAIPVSLEGGTDFRVRMIDCVGYLVPAAEGHMDGDLPRMVHTPWSEEAMPFVEAAEAGTKKVITDHSTIGIVVTTDGSVTELDREDYLEAEERVISELRELGRPFVVLLNTAAPYDAETAQMRAEMEEKYGVPVLAVNVAQLKTEDIQKILERVLYQFPMKELRFYFPGWVETLEQDHWLKRDLISSLKQVMEKTEKLEDIPAAIEEMTKGETIQKAYTDKILPGEGAAEIGLAFDDGLFYKVLSETVDLPIENDYSLVETIKLLSAIKKEYDKISGALQDVKRKGYGVVTPAFEEITLEKPEVFKQGSRYGIKLRAKGESIHLIKADVETEVSPIIGNEEQSHEFIDNLIADYEEEPEKIWDLNIFGRTLSAMVNDGMQNKIYRMPEDAQMKLQETLQRIVNEGSGGLICIIL
ncbi:stage IV sporulation protein A [Anaerotignum lactatifermentans]|uniref:Stage IV sporulation protein A n=1 Tax=Anaerotignum lactatifermentans TaxID=160404 RepID=A0ABS2G7D4_9FIRM|nr:stage IV sporulation protein A [Anaerotignum lactatifermentans]MBM6828882.1 stage IV sporulation protein A [Anaerotignum lactatifermentans]MBM6876945.1 stage IV sporulation protein A [Anaerotignum lactatifermentans]MBM6950503.1 stage IV sporulation protein A [Anaerotignum lactatifermentans]